MPSPPASSVAPRTAIVGRPPSGMASRALRATFSTHLFEAAAIDHHRHRRLGEVLSVEDDRLADDAAPSAARLVTAGSLRSTSAGCWDLLARAL
ncbi:MAG: hypothetical protein U0P30_09185 [Vicinamibacterales bacterium]